jgi:hypothetical protein
MLKFFIMILASMTLLTACDNRGQGTVEQQRAEDRGDENRLAPGLENPTEQHRPHESHEP